MPIKEQSKVGRPQAPAKSLEARENQVISLAVDLAEKQIREGTASSQVITHYLKLGSTRERAEKEILMQKKILMEAQVEQLKSQKHIEELYEGALKAMRTYAGQNDDENI